jgi:hypothetical protein
MNRIDHLQIYACVRGEDVRVGELFYGEKANMSAQHPVLNFQYDPVFLNSESAYQISPDLPLQKDVIRMKKTHPTPSVFEDMMPDIWGSNLLWRSSVADEYVKQNVLNPRFLHQLEVLFVSQDLIRQGNLRIKADGVFVAPQRDPMPVLGALDEITQIKNHYLAGSFSTEEILRLRNNVASVGGSAPKVNCMDNDGNLYIAKFYQEGTITGITSTPIFEEVAMQLAREIGIETEDSMFFQTQGNESVFIAKRFDRIAELRIPYWSLSSALTGKVPKTRFSYEKLGVLMKEIYGAEIARAFFERAVLNLAINNLDDHLGNTGFLYDFDSKKWNLAPLFDIYPAANPQQTSYLSVRTDSSNKRRKLADLLFVSNSFGVDRKLASDIVHNVASIVSTQWVERARALSARDVDILTYQPAFAESDLFLNHF